MNTKLLDVASGTGRFLTFVRDNFPEMVCTALELSPHYLEARIKEKKKKEEEKKKGNAFTHSTRCFHSFAFTCLFFNYNPTPPMTDRPP